MTENAWVQCIAYFAAVIGFGALYGPYMARVYEGKPGWLGRVFGPVESALYRLSGVDPDEGMGWKTYAAAALLFNMLGVFAVYALQRLQGLLPLNPAGFGAVAAHSAFNTAASFATNTNWQGYGGETTMSYLTQMLGLTVQNFLSAAAGMAVLAAFIRGLRARETENLGNFWADMVRTTLYILLPLSLVMAVVLVWQGVPQDFKPAAKAAMVETVHYDNNGKPASTDEQDIPLGPAASQIAIKQLGTNGGGYYNVNSAHPLENPTPLSNFVECWAILALAAACCIMFGVMVEDRRQGWAILAAMTVILVPMVLFCAVCEQRGNPLVAALGVSTQAVEGPAATSGGNMEGKEVRFGIADSALWAVTTTAASNGSVDSMHDSYTPLGGLIPLFMMQLGEVVYGGVGSGLYGMLVFVLVAVFVAGLMVGRTPEYLGKKIEAFEMKMASVVVLIMPILALVPTALAVVSASAKASLANPGAHGFSEILYAFTSMANNNGSAFAGLTANVPFYDILGGFVMLLGRYWIMVPTLAIAGSLSRKKIVPAGEGTLPTHTPLFVGLLVGVVLIVGALTFVPALALGPVAEHLMMIGVR
ncbi:MAG: potassium-transporting ATPase subunit KdpA [Elusimicrobia bacterium]|nr:potassium-transporting ATPase subunit KdpA [Elusimicrobiota bacterium]